MGKPLLFGDPLPRRCRGCGEVKPITDFNVDASRPDGHGYVCRACQRVSPVDTPNRIERAAARKRGLAWCRECRAWLPVDEVIRQGLCRTHKQAEERRRYAEDADFRERRRAHATKRRRGVERVPAIGRECLLERYEGCCVYCGSPAETWDHVVPVSKGGQTEPDNILPSCIACNSSKRDRDLEEWLAATGRELHPLAVEMLSHFQVLEG